MHLFGIRWLGVNAENGYKLLSSVAFIVVIIAGRYALGALVGLIGRGSGKHGQRVRFWTRQGISLTSAVLILLGLVSIWFEDPTRLATAAGLFSAGLAFALQRVIAAVAGYFVILRGNTFTVGDRITMGGVRGDVLALGFIQTTIMEMGQIAGADAAMWVKSRQFTGRIVTVSNAKVFDEPVYNYTRDFPYIWDEIHVPLPYGADRHRVEAILLEAARRHAVDPAQVSAEAAAHLERRYNLPLPAFTPKVYFRLTENWLDTTLRFIFTTHGVRDVKDAMSREILDSFEEAGISVAAVRREIVRARPPLDPPQDH